SAGNSADEGAQSSPAANLGYVALGVGFAFDHERFDGEVVGASTGADSAQRQVQLTGSAQSSGAFHAEHFARDVSSLREQCLAVYDHGSGKRSLKAVSDIRGFAAELVDDSYLQRCAGR